jgi:hypothetical protein
MSSTTGTRRNKHLMLDQTKLNKARKVLGTRTETEAIEQALDRVINEDEKDRRAWAAHRRFIESAVREKVQIKDVFGNMDEAQPNR